MLIERRKTPRTILNNISIELYSLTLPDQIEAKGKICDISHLGIKFSSDKPYRNGSIVHLAIQSEYSFIPTQISGRVIRCEQRDNVGFYTAVEFK